ncbi:MAG: transcription antitermination factor NusB, partial [Sulfobacillus sp.]
PAHHAAHQAVLGVLGMQAQADQIIGQLAKDWSIERMPPIDRNILRLAIWEMVSGLSPAVAINEAVELAKAYGAEDSPAFINGVLAGYLRREEGALSG